ncbi:transcriptional regulator GcvA [Ottowia sp.]|uniref:transcriptional regulator GcvA n=1 Tax=Ottowia sp. TaxID=1898956 RepID=UPI002C658E7D|nr:transcriptional regulator GcvA [Ottowia sp.]HOB67174.1 transcriptional regulator GcvA [Ottowia sp.]HPZ56351.1 transcriptional regulator GcvA [Ottowia sp.]HQD48168.1 transcriptional regulator GcvA [Ottowia sp.]
MIRRIPPLNPLRVFEVVARTQNLTAAAAELHVTQSAVSRQIANLETYLGVALFRRERHGVVLTRAGRAYADQVLPAFDLIASATQNIVKAASDKTLRVQTYTTFAAKWLIPRLGDFRKRHPGIEVKITTAVPDVDFDRDKADVAIQFGDGHWPGVQLALLFQDEIEPVCSPAYLARYAPNAKFPASLLRHQLLVSSLRKSDWHDWLAANDLTSAAEGAVQMSFGTSVLTWQAAVDGLGIAIGQNRLLAQDFEKGLLIRPFHLPLRGTRAYYLVWPRRARESRKVGLFKDWLLGEAGA